MSDHQRDRQHKRGSHTPNTASTLILAAIAIVGIGGCTSQVSLHAGEATLRASAPPQATTTRLTATQRTSGLGVTRLKRRVRILDERASFLDSHEQATSPLRAALVRALMESGRYEVVGTSGPDTTRFDADTIRMWLELVEAPQQMAVKLNIEDPRASGTVMSFTGEGAIMSSKGARLADRSAAAAQRQALDFAVGKALRNASAVLGVIPWQATVLEAASENRILIPDGKRLGLTPGVVLSVQTRDRVLNSPRGKPLAPLPGRLVGEVLIVDTQPLPGRGNAAVGTLLSGSLKGYDINELVVRFCRPSGYFGHDFGHDLQCDAKTAALTSFDSDTATLSFSDIFTRDAEPVELPYSAPISAPPSAIF